MSRVVKRKAWACIVAIGLAAAGGSVVRAQAGGAAAQTPATVAAPQESADQFVPMKSLPQEDQLPAAPLLVAAYAFVWVALLVYVWSIWRRLTKVEREIQQLSSRLSESASRH
jgi:CcmD family protein